MEQLILLDNLITLISLKVYHEMDEVFEELAFNEFLFSLRRNVFNFIKNHNLLNEYDIIIGKKRGLLDKRIIAHLQKIIDNLNGEDNYLLQFFGCSLEHTDDLICLIQDSMCYREFDNYIFKWSVKNFGFTTRKKRFNMIHKKINNYILQLS